MSQTRIPTGFVLSDLPFYEEMDDQGFEQFCTDLLNQRPVVVRLRNGQPEERMIMKADRLLSGTPQRGVDIRAVAAQGEVWFFQSKHVKEFGPAKVTEAIELAEKGFPQADQFVLVTASGLSEEAQRRINDRQKWLWWGPTHLTNMALNLQPREAAVSLVHRFFGPEAVKRNFVCSDQPLLTWQEFFARDLSEERKHFHHRIPFVTPDQTLEQLKAFAQSGAGRALVLSAAGGQGKSRMLLELAKCLEGRPQAPRVRFLNLSRRGLREEQSEFLAREEGDLLLIVDDAHRLDAAMEEVARASIKSASIRLLVASRPQALGALQSLLYKGGYAERLEAPISLSRWSQHALHKLAENVLNPEYRHRAARLVALADCCPLMVVLGGSLVNSGAWPETVKDEEAFQERVFKSFRDDFLIGQPENRRERLNRFINFLSFVSPTPKNDAVLNKAADIIDCSPLDVDDDIESLRAAGLLAENSEGIRLYPDLFADAVLMGACLDGGGKPSPLYKMIVSKLPSSDFPALLRNLAQADWETRAKAGGASLLFEPVWDEFVRQFQAGVWVASWDIARQWILEPYLEKDRTRHHADRAQMLSQWASFAVYLPEKTLALASLTLQTLQDAEVQQCAGKASLADVRSSVSSSLPALLRPVAIWHPQSAAQALDILWCLDADEPKGDGQSDSNAIAAIAHAASFAIDKPLAASEGVLKWLESKFRDAAAVERIRREPWILSALLKPFFGRAVEHNWTTGRTVHFSSLPVAADKTRSLRERALKIVDGFLAGDDIALCHAVVPVAKEAIQPVWHQFGASPSEGDQQAWRPDRLAMLAALEKAVKVHRDFPGLLLQLRNILRNRAEYDPDEFVRDECRRVFSTLPDTLEMRIALTLTSYAHHEFGLKPGPNFETDCKAAEVKWAKFCESTACEVVDRCKTAKDVRDFIGCKARELAAAKHTVLGWSLLEAIVRISPNWCAGLLEELLNTQDATLDLFLRAILAEANRSTPEVYQRALETLPTKGRPQQLCSLLGFLGWKQLHGGGLSELERRCVLESAGRTEAEIVAQLASNAGIFFSDDPSWAIEVLSRLKPVGGRDAYEILEALGNLAERHKTLLDHSKVAKCLANLGDHCFSEHPSGEDHLGKVAQVFPRLVYEHVRDLYRRMEAKPPEQRSWGPSESVSLGRIGDDEYMRLELSQLWKEAVALGPVSIGQHVRLSLIRSLIWSDAAQGPDRLRSLIARCGNGDELQLAAKLAATQGSQFVFDYPDIVKLLLDRACGLGISDAVRQTLWLSACGGGRSYTEGELDPDYRYIQDKATLLANRHHGDALLESFYRMVAESEHQSIEWRRRTFHEAEELV